VAQQLRQNLFQLTERKPLAAVHVLPATSFFERLLLIAFGRSGNRWNSTLDLLLHEAVQRLPNSSVLGPLKSSLMAFASLRGTFLDLADAGFVGAQADILKEVCDDPATEEIDATTLHLYLAWIRAVEVMDLAWDPLLLQQLVHWIQSADPSELARALAVEDGQSPTIMVFGFYDFTDLNLQLLSNLAAKSELRLYFPHFEGTNSNHPAFDFSGKVLKDFQLRSGSHRTQSCLINGLQNPVCEYFLASFPVGSVPPQPDWLTYQTASGVRAECISAAVRVRRWVQEGIPAEDILIVSPVPARYRLVLPEIFGAFRIPLKLTDIPVNETPSTRPLKMLARICEGGASTEWLLAYLRELPIMAKRRGIDLNHFEQELRKLPIWGGDAWLRLSDLLVEQPDSLSFTEVEEVLIQEIAQLWSSPASSELSPWEALGRLDALSHWLDDTVALEPLRETLERVHQLAPTLTIHEELLWQLLAEGYTNETYSDPEEPPGVRFLPMMRARGLTSKAIVLLGLAAHDFPWAIDEDPFFSDSLRSRLAGMLEDLGHRLPVKAAVHQETPLLFLLTHLSSERVHWVIPETDEHGRAVAPTPWVQRYIQSWSDDLSIPRDEWRRISRNPIEQAHYLLSLDPAGGSFLPPSFGLLLWRNQEDLSLSDIETSHLVDIMAGRRNEAEWNGKVVSASVASGSIERISVTRLETLAKCPYRFYVAFVLGLEPTRALVFSESPRALLWGGYIHECLERLLRKRPRLETVRTWAGALLEDRSVLEEIAESSFGHELMLLPPLLQNAARTQAVRLLSAFLRAYMEGELSDGVPLELELRLTRKYPNLNSVEISGRLDRVDERTDGTWILDYKSGREPVSSKAVRSRHLGWGFLLQPTLYPWLGEALSTKGRLPGFSYIFLGGGTPRQWTPLPKIGADAVLASLKAILSKGLYFPTSQRAFQEVGLDNANTCQWCEYSGLCRRYERSSEQSAMRCFIGEAGERFEWLRRLSGQEDG
jgi:hypothetical protein